MTQDWNSDKYAKDAAFVSALGTDVVTLLDPKPGEKILDLGCGDGTLAKQIIAQGATVTGIDASEDMVKAALALGINAHCISGEQLSFDEDFDAVFSNAALHWMQDYHAVVAGVYRALKPGGRFIAEFGGHGNVQAITNAMARVYSRHPDWGAYKHPWFFPTDEYYAKVLRQQGFQINAITLFDRPTPLETGIKQWLKLFAHHATGYLNETETEDFLTQVEAHLKTTLYNEDDGWYADYVRLRFSATKPTPD